MTAIRDDTAIVATSPLFDEAWYLLRYPEVGRLDISPAEHYVRIGVLLQRDPGPAFSTRDYLAAHPDVAAQHINPLVHHAQAKSGDTRRNAQGGIEQQVALLTGNPLFDRRYYLDTYADVRKHGMDPVVHFVKYGARENRQPNPWFSTSQYRATCQQKEDAGNPLVHYITHPECWGACTSEQFDGAFYWSRYEDAAQAGCPPLQHFLEKGLTEGRETRLPLPREATAHIVDVRHIRTTVVVPVFNAPDAVAACLESVLRHTPLGQANQLLVMNDASTDPEVAGVLQRAAGRPGVRVETNTQNLGYTRTINKACELAGEDDVVLLNSDTEVGPLWLRNLKVAAYRQERIGTVTAVSDNAGMFSVPRAGSNAIPDVLDTGAMARLAAGCRDNQPFEVPTGNGFCMYVKRTLIQDVGQFDAEGFPVGYGEENEFCMRALEAGWRHVVDPHTFVKHRRSASFGERREQLVRDGLERLAQIHPEYGGAIRGITMSRPFQIARYRMARSLDEAINDPAKASRPRILFSIATRVGGTPQTNLDLMRALEDRYECYALWCDRNTIEVLRGGKDGYRTLRRYPLTEPVRFATHVSGNYDDIVRSILVEWGIELLHIRHLAWHSLNLVDVASSLDIPVIHSFHDYYAICPSFTLVDADGRYHPKGVADKARNPLWRNDPTATEFNAVQLRHWQKRMQDVLSGCQAFITTSQSAKSVLMDALPLLAERKNDFHVVPHGRDFEHFHQLAENAPIPAGEPLRILLPGNIGLQKGMELIRQIKKLDVEGLVEFHLLGKCDPYLAEHVVDHGAYPRDEFADRVMRIRPHIAAVLSIWSETWCHTLTECWSCGLPVLGIDIGAVGERMRQSGAGWLLPFPAQVDVALVELLRIRDATEERRDKVLAAVQWQQGVGDTQSVDKMMKRYEEIYRPVMMGEVAVD